MLRTGLLGRKTCASSLTGKHGSGANPGREWLHSSLRQQSQPKQVCAGIALSLVRDISLETTVSTSVCCIVHVHVMCVCQRTIACIVHVCVMCVCVPANHCMHCACMCCACTSEPLHACQGIWRNDSCECLLVPACRAGLQRQPAAARLLQRKLSFPRGKGAAPAAGSEYTLCVCMCVCVHVCVCQMF